MEVIKRIDSEILVLNELKSFLGKRVRINIEVLEDQQRVKPVNGTLGRYKLGKNLDEMNTRDFAYDA